MQRGIGAVYRAGKPVDHRVFTKVKPVPDF